MGDCGEIGGIKIGRGNRSTRRKPSLAPLCPPQIPHDWTRIWTRAAAVRSQRLTAWSMAGPDYKPCRREVPSSGRKARPTKWKFTVRCKTFGKRKGPVFDVRTWNTSVSLSVSSSTTTKSVHNKNECDSVKIIMKCHTSMWPPDHLKISWTVH
jgi:hypothetical protein